jgi:acyl-CoA thioester hydrolase
VHQFEIRVRWSECDPYDHVNHAAYLTYLETARIDALSRAGWSMARLREAGSMIVVAALEITFHRPAGCDDHLVVQTAVAEVGRASCVFRQEIRREGELLATASVTGAVIDAAGRPRRLGTDLGAALSTLE